VKVIIHGQRWPSCGPRALIDSVPQGVETDWQRGGISSTSAGCGACRQIVYEFKPDWGHQRWGAYHGGRNRAPNSEPDLGPGGECQCTGGLCRKALA